MRRQSTMEKRTTTNLRYSEELKEKLKALAEENHRTLNAQMVYMLEQAVKEEEEKRIN